MVSVVTTGMGAGDVVGGPTSIDAELIGVPSGPYCMIDSFWYLCAENLSKPQEFNGAKPNTYACNSLKSVHIIV
jgi:hypothetical protein